MWGPTQYDRSIFRGMATPTAVVATASVPDGCRPLRPIRPMSAVFWHDPFAGMSANEINFISSRTVERHLKSEYWSAGVSLAMACTSFLMAWSGWSVVENGVISVQVRSLGVHS